MDRTLLIIEDVPEMAALMELYLKKEGYTVVVAGTGEVGLLEVNRSSFDLIILDLNLPGIDGFQTLKLIRDELSTPVLIVSARDDDEDVIKGLNIGADEYMSKPFSPKVLTARVNALLRHNKRADITFGPYTFNRDNYLLKKGEKRVLISGKEFEVLAMLIESSGKPLTAEEIFNTVWSDVVGDITTVAVHIQRIRKKLEDDPANPRYIKTIRGQGYCFGWDL